MRALVTGGGGFLGRYIVERLVARGDAVRVLGRRRYPELEPLGVETVQADVRDEAAVVRACAGIEVVFHTAAHVVVWGRWRDCYETNVQGTRHVLTGCQAQGVRRLVYTSTPSVIFDGSDLCGVNETVPYPARYTSAYPATKALAERAVIEANGRHGLLTAALRPHLLWGPRDPHLLPTILQRARAGQLVIVGDGANQVDLTYVENGADAHLLAADRLTPGSPVAGQVYFISQGRPVVLWEFLNQVFRKLGIAPVSRRISRRTARVLGAVNELGYRLLPVGEPRITRLLADELATSHYFDISKARRDLGYEPRVSLEEGLERFIAFLDRSGAPDGKMP
ncbi:MAG: NAD-dependent epimerase/dehydratase family protein [Candidatus Omnitrophica bacterium]|nr:NAD-dependent epimerase/dehydratase family protein [Candidatus Omnitrophota bacterium]